MATLRYIGARPTWLFWPTPAARWRSDLADRQVVKAWFPLVGAIKILPWLTRFTAPFIQLFEQLIEDYISIERIPLCSYVQFLQ